jgi:hypothetical protein
MGLYLRSKNEKLSVYAAGGGFIVLEGKHYGETSLSVCIHLNTETAGELRDLLDDALKVAISDPDSAAEPEDERPNVIDPDDLVPF